MEQQQHRPGDIVNGWMLTEQNEWVLAPVVAPPAVEREVVDGAGPGFCERCGKPLAAGASFCGRCGSPTSIGAVSSILPSRAPDSAGVKWPLVGALAVGVVLLLVAAAVGYRVITGRSAGSGSAAGSPSGDSVLVAGTFTNATALETVGGSASSNFDHMGELIDGKTFDCSDGGQYPVMYKTGTQIQVTDGAGVLLATGTLGPGMQDMYGCHFTFSLSVPAATLYKITVGGSNAYGFSPAEAGQLNLVVGSGDS